MTEICLNQQKYFFKTQKCLFHHYLHFLKLHIINNYLNSLFIRSRRLPLRPHEVAGISHLPSVKLGCYNLINLWWILCKMKQKYDWKWCLYFFCILNIWVICHFALSSAYYTFNYALWPFNYIYQVYGRPVFNILRCLFLEYL